jgi:hypothetical protein
MYEDQNNVNIETLQDGSQHITSINRDFLFALIMDAFNEQINFANEGD